MQRETHTHMHIIRKTCARAWDADACACVCACVSAYVCMYAGPVLAYGTRTRAHASRSTAAPSLESPGSPRALLLRAPIKALLSLY